MFTMVSAEATICEVRYSSFAEVCSPIGPRGLGRNKK